jgi:hypothetical protein
MEGICARKISLKKVDLNFATYREMHAARLEDMNPD